MTPAELKKLREKVDTAERLTARIEAASALIELLDKQPSQVLITDKALEIKDPLNHTHLLLFSEGMRHRLLRAIDVVLRQNRSECAKMLENIEP